MDDEVRAQAAVKRDAHLALEMVEHSALLVGGNVGAGSIDDLVGDPDQGHPPVGPARDRDLGAPAGV